MTSLERKTVLLDVKRFLAPGLMPIFERIEQITVLHLVLNNFYFLTFRDFIWTNLIEKCVSFGAKQFPVCLVSCLCFSGLSDTEFHLM